MERLRSFIKQNVFLLKPIGFLYDKYMVIKYSLGGVKIVNKGRGRIRKSIRGMSNQIIIGSGTQLDDVFFRIVGNNNRIVFGENCKVRKNSSFWMEGSNIEIIIGNNCTFNHTNHFCAQEDNTKIVLGDGCMFSNNIIIRTSDSHKVLDRETGERLNLPGNVVIGKHVWVAAQVLILKGVEIGDDSIIATKALVSKNIPSGCIAAGVPAKVIKTNITWSI